MTSSSPHTPAPDDQSYRQTVRESLRTAMECMAFLSMGDFEPRVDIESLPDDEFGELFCGLDVLRADLAETRAELDQENHYSQVRSRMWETASEQFETVVDFVQTLFDTIGPTLDLMRTSYYDITHPQADAECLCQWCADGVQATIGLKIPHASWSTFADQGFVELHRDKEQQTDIPHAVKILMDRTGIGSLVVVPCGPPDSLIGFVTFSSKSPRRQWHEQDKSFLSETARIITVKAAQISAAEALRRANARLNEEVLARTSELQQANRDLQEDIAKRREAEEALRESEALHRSLIETSPDAIFMCSTEGIVTMANPSAAVVLGMPTRSGLVGNQVQSYVSGSDRPRLEALWDELKAGQRAATGEYSFTRADGTHFLGEFRGTAIRSGGGDIAGYLVIIRDITVKRREEEELQRASKLESLGTVAGGIAHDFNNILTGVISNIGLAKHPSVQREEAVRLLQDAESAAMRATSLTRQLLTFAKGGVPLTEYVDVHDLLDNAARFSLSGSNVAYRLETTGDLPGVEVDRSQLEQVLNNLIINADQAMPGGGTIVLSAEAVVVDGSSDLPLEPGEFVRVCVKDTGMGIPEDSVQRVFDPYYTTKPEGTGLGLTTAYSIISRHQGYLQCQSTPGKGSEFCFYVPTAKGTRPAVKEAPAKDLAIGEGRVLVMDDDYAVRLVLDRILTRAGYEIDTVEDGAQAVEAYRKAMHNESAYAAVIMDLTIQGGKGGRETAREVLTLDPDARIIVVSGYSNDPILADYRTYGFVAMLTKPFETSELTQVVRDVVGGRG